MLKGYMGRILHVDLSTRTLTEEATPEDMARNFLGGYGIGVRLLYSRQEAGVDPLGPGNTLGFITGPLTGTPAIVGSRYAVVGKSPLTGTWGDANSGGYFGPNLKFAGYDGVLVTGVSTSPVYLLLDNGKAELRDATKLWGKDTTETEELLQAELGAGIHVAAIGQAGENLSLIAAIINDRGRAAARSGLGAVMGSKKLKAMVVRGNQPVPLADPETARSLRKKYLSEMTGHEGLQKYGTSRIVEGAVVIGAVPIKNWAGAGELDFPNASAVGGESIVAFQEKRYPCWRCPVGCGGIMHVDHSELGVEEGHKPEYETIGAFGTLCLNDNVRSIIKANDLCNRYGLDTISTGATIAFAIECFENGLLTERDTDGLLLRWGDHQAIVALVHKIARREGVGGVLADGVMRASQRIGPASEEFAIHFGGQEPAMMDPRFHTGLAMFYAIDATPGRHLQGGSWAIGFPQSWRQRLGLTHGPESRGTYSGMGETYKRTATILHVVQSSGLCYFPWYYLDPINVPEFLTAVTGEPVDLARCFEIGERIGQLRHCFGLREGWNPLRVKVPGRTIGKPPLERGPRAGVTVDVETLTRDFFAAMRWDVQTALPDPVRLEELGLTDAAADVRAMAPGVEYGGKRRS